ncbi:transposase [Bdellovibrio sp. HCB288]|uniref:transposase n=1 Tax=Bdellovibrio sp. HCB288 TaxID=3394355 RepID=UPI0039B48AC8
MARKKVLYTHELPYHVMARSNNKEWFYLPIKECWYIFQDAIKKTQQKYGLNIYAFVLMDNHYHMLVQCSDKFTLGETMNYLQKTVSKAINKKAGRINHVFGGPYKPTLVKEPESFASVYKYILRNPIKAGLANHVEDYRFSTLNTPGIELSPENEWFATMPNDRSNWLNIDFEAERYLAINRALKRTDFKIADRIRID